MGGSVEFVVCSVYQIINQMFEHDILRSVVLRHYFNFRIFTFGRCGIQSSFAFLAVSCLVSVRPRSTTIGICNNNNSGRIVRGNVSVIGTGLMLAHRELVFMLQEEDT